MNVASQQMEGTVTINPAHIMSDGMSAPSSPETDSFDPSDLLTSDEITSQLSSSGTIGMAAAAAILTGKKRKRSHQFETNPSNRKRQQTRLLRKLKLAIEEFTTRVGQQAVIVCCTPGKGSKSIQNFKVFGSQPLETVMRNCRGMILQDLEAALAEQVMPQSDHSGMHELPSLCIDGIPTPVDKMTQAQLRAFIPLMLKYSTGRGKPGWGKLEHRPLWWPDNLPWANVRSDARTEEQKQKVSWTDALRQIVKNCYKSHGREDLLHIFSDDCPTIHQNPAQYTMNGSMLQTVNNPDGSLSIIQIDTTSPGNVVTLADGTQATVLHAQVDQGQGLTGAHVGSTVTEQVNALNFDGTGDGHQNTVSLPGAAAIGQDHQLVLTGDTNLTTAEGGVVTIPVSLYQIVHPSVNLQPQFTAAPSQSGIHAGMTAGKDVNTASLQLVEVMSEGKHT